MIFVKVSNFDGFSEEFCFDDDCHVEISRLPNMVEDDYNSYLDGDE